MESVPRDPYERQLLEVFRSCDCDGKGLLDNEGLSKLCELLHLEDGKDELMACLLPNGPSSSAPSVSFAKFRDALLKLLGGVGGNPDKRECSPVREVSPKYVYGQKKYGRRSRPESSECTGSSDKKSNGDACLLQNNSVNKILSSSSMLTNKSDETNNEEPICNDLSKNIDVEPSGFFVIDKDSEVLGEAELRRAWERLGVGTGGYMHKNELAMVCSAVGMDTLADQVVSQVFSSLKTDEEGRICFEDFLEFFKSKIEEPAQTPQFIQYSKSPNIMDLCDFPHAGNRRLLHELQALKCELEAVTEERDKLKCDIADADRRSTLLAQEIDERHARIEKTAALTVETLELKHAEEIRILQKQMALEREQLVATNQRLEESLANHVEQLSKVWQDLTSLQKEYENLEKENQTLSSKLTARDVIKREYQEQLECMEALHQRVLELESTSEMTEKLQDKINLLQSENTDLRDKNDELTSQIELLICRNSKRREGSWGAFEYGGGTKRRGKSPERFSDNRLGKVRRCCTETDLTLHSTGSLNLQKIEPNESGLEEDLSALQDTSLDNDTDWELSTSSYDKIERMKSYIAELEAKLEHYQTEDWLLPNYKDEDKTNVTSSTESTLATDCANNASNTFSQTCSGDFTEKSDINSYLEVGVQTSGIHCHQVEGELELVRSKILEVLSEKKACSEEVCALKLRLESLMSGIARPNMDCLRCKASVISSRTEIEALKEENISILNRCSELENSLELLRIEYEKTEDYWENKLDEERKLFELDKEQSDEKFAELEAKIQEYAEMIISDQTKRLVLPPIEEKDILEKQFTDLEEEYEAYRLTTEEELAVKENLISELKEKLNLFKLDQIEDWLLPNYKDEDKTNVTSSTESTLATDCANNASNTFSQTCSGDFTEKSDINSYLEVGVQTSGIHCHQVEGELELVRSKILEVLSEKKACSEEVCALKLRLESLMSGIARPNMDCLRCKASVISSRTEIEALKEENISILNRCSELENSLELLRIEYEKTEDYWENKLDEERKLFELDKEQSDEKFAELEAKIQEYAEMIISDQTKRLVLPPIEEKDILEKQFTDLEEEYEAYRLTTEEELAVKENLISELKEKLNLFKLDQIETKDEQCQTENPKCPVKPKVTSTSYKSSESHKKPEGCICGGKVKFRDKLKAEVDALSHRKQLLMAQITSLQAQPHQLGVRMGAVGGNLGVFQSLSNRLRQQELRCRELQSALRSQQKETETILQKAWERHKIDLTTIQNSLRVTQEKLQQQKKNTKQQLDRLAMTDTLVKDLYAENAHLVATVVSLEHKFHSLSESALHNSF